MSKEDPQGLEATRARYNELLSFLESVKEQVVWWKETFPKSNTAAEFNNDFMHIYKQAVETHEQLVTGDRQWKDLPEGFLQKLDKFRAAALEHMDQFDFQAACRAEQDGENVEVWWDKQVDQVSTDVKNRISND